MESRFAYEVNQHLQDGRTIGLPVSDMAFSIILSAGKYPDDEVVDVFASLPSEVKAEIELAISEYKRTREYHVISSTGVTKDLSELMRRISKLI